MVKVNNKKKTKDKDVILFFLLIEIKICVGENDLQL